ncbi:MAG: Crp/Fnr family transcriptional regulator [Bacteroidia bacterium]|nr:Crp/Fnr family transcriptional regulator [Bacteroidia bacterium]
MYLRACKPARIPHTWTMHPLLRDFLASIPELGAADREALAPLLRADEYPQGTVLLQPDSIACRCYWVLKGCVRQYLLAGGQEKTTAFFTENQAVADFASYARQQPAGHYWVCLEDCVLLAGDLGEEHRMYEAFPALELVTRRMMAEDFGEMQHQWAAFMTRSPEERYLHLLGTRPDLLQRVPQHQLASYLGVTPESLSRIRRRLRSR